MPLSAPDLVRETELYRSLAQNGHELIWQAGITGRFLYASPNSFLILGYQPQELIGHSFFKFVHPDDQPAVNRFYVLGLITSRQSQLQFRFRHKGGEWRWLETAGQPFQGLAGRWRATLVLRDVSHLRDLEERLRHADDLRDGLLASTTNAIALLDASGRMTGVNTRLCDFAGGSESTLMGRDLASLVAPADQPALREAISSIVTKNAPSARCEAGLRHPQGGERRLVFHFHPLVVEGCLTGLVFAGEDLTELRQSEESREYLLRQLEVAQKLESIGKMSAGVAHDFNNVLAGALTTTELLRAELANRPDLTRLLSLQQRAIERASHLTQQLLAFSRHEAIVARPVDLAARIHDILEFCSTQFDKRILVETDLPPALPFVLGDGGQIDQILLNLLLNAGQALLAVADEGRTPRIRVETRPERITAEQAQRHGLAAGETMLRLTIRDNGPGIPAALQSQIFDPFFTTKSPSANHGLGLSTTHAIVRNHRGAIEVESRPGHETAFHVYLPRCVEESCLPEPDLAPDVVPQRTGLTQLHAL